MNLYDGTRDALFQMERYGGHVFDENVLKALWALTGVNDDLWHGRDEQCVRESVDKVRSALEKIVAPTPCTDPFCACRGGPCAECPEGQTVAARDLAQGDAP